MTLRHLGRLAGLSVLAALAGVGSVSAADALTPITGPGLAWLTGGLTGLAMAAVYVLGVELARYLRRRALSQGDVS